MATTSPRPATADTEVPRRVGRPRGDTRERILDTALSLFIEQGYDKTSLREIADRLGFTKAAVYYHFERKEDILLALHLRLHDLGRGLVDQLNDLERSGGLERWQQVFDDFIDQLVANRDLFVLHTRNQNSMKALQGMHDHDHDEDFEERVRGFLSNDAIPLEARVRLTCTFGAVVVPLVAATDSFGNADPDELVAIVRQAVADLLSP